MEAIDPSKRRAFSDLHGVTSQKTLLFSDSYSVVMLAVEGGVIEIGTHCSYLVSGLDDANRNLSLAQMLPFVAYWLLYIR
jgi:hypothetical protein